MSRFDFWLVVSILSSLVMVGYAGQKKSDDIYGRIHSAQEVVRGHLDEARSIAAKLVDPKEQIVGDSLISILEECAQNKGYILVSEGVRLDDSDAPQPAQSKALARKALDVCITDVIAGVGIVNPGGAIALASVAQRMKLPLREVYDRTAKEDPVALASVVLR